MSYPTPDGGNYSTTPSPSPIPPTPSGIYDGSTTSSIIIRTSILPDTTLGPTTPTVSPITTPLSPSPRPTTSTTSSWSTSKEITTSTPVPVISVSSSNGVARTYTSTSYSSYRTPVAKPTSTEAPTTGSSTNVGAIVGGVVGGVAFLVLLGIIAFIMKKRRRKHTKEVYNDPNMGKEYNPHPFNNDDFNSYGSPPAAADEGGKQLGAAAMVAGTQPRPFVQAYNPGYDDQQSKQYTGSPSPPQSEQQQQQYYEDYQGYQPSYTNNSNYNSGAYDAMGQYSHQQDTTGQYPPMQDNRQYIQDTYPQQQHDSYYQTDPSMTVVTSTTGMSSNGGRNVPDEIDYYTPAGARGPSTRHVPDEA